MDGSMRQKQSGGAMGIFMILAALVLSVGPFFVPLQIPTLSQIIISGFGVILLIFGTCIATITRLYKKTSADESFVRTGMGGAKAIIDGGAIVIPIVHQTVAVSLRTMKLEVPRHGENALITGDNLRADVTAEFFVKVQRNEEDVLTASRSLGERATNPALIQEVIFEKLVNALRTVAATKPLHELNSKREEFAAAVQAIVEKDLAHNGLTLETSTISKLDQTPVSFLKPDDNVFDAQGARRIAEITQQARVERNKIERQAEKEVKERDVETAKYILEKDLERASAQAAQEKNVQIAQTTAKQEAETVAAEQARLAGIAYVEKDKAIQVAEVLKAQALEVANQKREEAGQIAEIEKQRSLEISGREKEIAVATKEKERAAAETERFATEAEREKKKQEVLTVEITSTAEREKEQAIIKRKAGIEQEKLQKEMEADVKAYAQVAEAKGEQEAADKKAAARRVLAEADKTARLLEAEGETAVQAVPVNVAAQQVEVERKRVEVNREDLKNKAEFETISRELQVELAKIEAEKQIRVEMAHSFGVAMASAKMTIWGSPESVEKMSQAFLNGQAKGFFADGLIDSMPNEVKETAVSAAHGMGKIGAAIVEALTGKRIEPEHIETVVQKIIMDDGK